MTYDEAKTIVRARYDAGEREIGVSPEVYLAYRDGLETMWRVSGRPHRDKEFLCFKAAKVWMLEPLDVSRTDVFDWDEHGNRVR